MRISVDDSRVNFNGPIDRVVKNFRQWLEAVQYDVDIEGKGEDLEITAKIVVTPVQKEIEGMKAEEEEQRCRRLARS